MTKIKRTKNKIKRSNKDKTSEVKRIKKRNTNRRKTFKLDGQKKNRLKNPSKFLKSDPDDLHDHPWAFRTLILAGGYWEFTDEGKFWRGPLSYNYAPANTFHRVELDKNVPYCWTLFIPSKSFKEWGFKTANGWLKHDDYFSLKKCV